MGIFTNGYMGTILRVNLSTGITSTEPLSETLVLPYIGGRGIGARILYDELAPGVEPLSEANKLIFMTGPLAATAAQSCSRWIVTTKSPLTGGMFRSSAGGGFGAGLKACGYDVLIIEGTADRPVYLWIQDDTVEILPAGHLAGRLSNETAEAIRSEHNDRGIKVAAIGPAGEAMVRFAAIVDDRRTASRGGVGAVMGSKHLKAIAARGTRKTTVYDPAALADITKKQTSLVQNEPRYQGFKHLGTAAAVGFCHEFGLYPVKNFQDGVLDNVSTTLTGEQVEEFFVKDARCHRCHINCGTVLKVPEGPYAVQEIEGPEYETLYSFGGEVGNTNLAMIIEANRICDEYGVDTMSAGCSVGFAMECYEKGLLTKDDLDGLDISWGNHAEIIQLLKKIVQRQGIGDILAEGTRAAAQKIGGGAEKFAMQVKGLELPGYEPRGIKAGALNLATAALGASHCVGQSPQEIMGDGSVDRFAVDGKGAMCKGNQDRVAAYETGIVCIFPMALRLVTLEDLTKMLFAATGVEAFRDEAYLLTAGERIWNLERAFNVLEGFSRCDDYLPSRFLTEELPRGPVKGQVVEMDRLLDDYYDARQWDRQTGCPSREKLESLGLGTVADDLNAPESS